jgi:polysaccharide export outer membrane protein
LALVATFFSLTLSSAAQSAASGGGGSSGSYVISPLDYLRVSLFVADEVQFSAELRVSQDGSITVPHLGTVNVSNRSIEEMREDLYEPYNRDYYVNPHIEIVVLQYSERSVTVIGKVNRQGLIPFPSEKGLTLLEAIAAAGGWSNDRLADKDSVTITRKDENGEKFVIEVDARKLTTQDYPLQEGDLVNVPERLW